MKLDIDTIVKGVPINKNNEINYTATIVVSLDKNIEFEYNIVDEGSENTETFSKAQKIIVIRHKNNNDNFIKKILLLKANEKVSADVNIEIEQVLPDEFFPQEGMGPVGQVLMKNNDIENVESDKPAWYKDPWIVSIIIIGIVLLSICIMKRKSNNNEFSFE